MPNQEKRMAAWEHFWGHGLGEAPVASSEATACASVCAVNASRLCAAPVVGSLIPLPLLELSRALVALRSIRWPVSMRRYVPGDGFCVGASMNARGATFNRPHSFGQEVLVKRVNQLIAASAHPSFVWTSLQFNKNTVASPHIDQHNRGLSWILICGSYTGGAPARTITLLRNTSR